jgi:hypothetical protein
MASMMSRVAWQQQQQQQQQGAGTVGQASQACSNMQLTAAARGHILAQLQPRPHHDSLLHAVDR